MKRNLITLITLILLIGLLAVLAACSDTAEPTAEPTEEIYMPTRSEATLAVPTRASTCTNVVAFLGDVNYEDGTVVPAGTTFVKEWEVQNYGDCDWDENYHLYFVAGDQMGAPNFVEIPSVPQGAKGRISVELTAPTEPGEYRSEWKLFGADNRFFGESLYVEIVVE